MGGRVVSPKTLKALTGLLESVSVLQVSVANCIQAETKLMQELTKRLILNGDYDQALSVHQDTFQPIRTNLKLQMLLQVKLEEVLESIKSLVTSQKVEPSSVQVKSNEKELPLSVSPSCWGTVLPLTSTCWGDEDDS